MTPHPLDEALTALNTRLKAAKLGLKIERRGETLNLRGTLPPRPDSPKLRPSQQRIPLGFPAHKVGLKQIEKTAKVIAAQLIENTFDWHNYLGPTAGLNRVGADLSAQIKAFQIHFFPAQRKQPSARFCAHHLGKSLCSLFTKAQRPSRPAP